MENIVYKIDNGYPIIDYPPAIDETFLAGTKEEIDGVIKFTPQELQDAWDTFHNKESLNAQIQEANQYLKDTGWIWEKFSRNVVVLKDMTEEEFSLKYADIIAEQERNRLLVNELEIQLGGN